MAEITWPQLELVQQLKNRSPAINITLENIDNITDRSVTIYSIADDTSAVPPPSEGSWPAADQGATRQPSIGEAPVSSG
jgi:hypothetical protein